MKLSKEYGFSLIELMIVMGLIGVAALGSARIMKNVAMTSKTSEIGMEVNAVMNSITQNLLSSEGCSNTLRGVGIIVNDLEIEDIKNRTNKVLFDKVKKYGNNRLKIDKLHIDEVEIQDPQPGVNRKYGEFRLQVRMEKLGKAFHGAKYVTKSVPLQAELDMSNNLTKCYSATEDAVYSAKKESCEDVGGTWVITSDTCELNDGVGRGIAASTERVDELLRDLMDSHLPETYVAVAGDTMTGRLTINSDLSVTGNADTRNITNALRTTSNEFCIGANCRTTFALQACPSGEISTGMNPDGTLNCRPIVCPAGTYFEAIDPDTNNVVCNALPSETCPLNQYVSQVNTNGSIVCSPLPPGLNQNCTGGRVVTGVQPNGTIVCNFVTVIPPAANFRCPEGEKVVGFDASGRPFCEFEYSGNLRIRFGTCSTRNTNYSSGSNHMTQSVECSANQMMTELSIVTGKRIEYIKSIKCCDMIPWYDPPNPQAPGVQFQALTLTNKDHKNTSGGDDHHDDKWSCSGIELLSYVSAGFEDHLQWLSNYKCRRPTIMAAAPGEHKTIRVENCKSFSTSYTNQHDDMTQKVACSGEQFMQDVTIRIDKAGEYIKSYQCCDIALR